MKITSRHSCSTCKPHRASSKSSPSADYLPTLVSAHMMGLVCHIGGSLHPLHKLQIQIHLISLTKASCLIDWSEALQERHWLYQIYK